MGVDREKTSERLLQVNLRLTQEMEERKRAEESLLDAYRDLKRLKDRLQAENLYLQQEVAQEHNFGELIGRSSALLQLRCRIRDRRRIR